MATVRKRVASPQDQKTTNDIVKEVLGITPETAAVREEAFVAKGQAHNLRATVRRRVEPPPVTSGSGDAYLDGIMERVEAELDPQAVSDELKGTQEAEFDENHPGYGHKEHCGLVDGSSDVCNFNCGVERSTELATDTVDNTVLEGPKPWDDHLRPPMEKTLDLDAVFQKDFGADHAEVKRVWELMHEPGVMYALKMAVDLSRNPPKLEVNYETEFNEVKEEIRTLVLEAVEDTATLAKGELITSTEMDEIALTDEDLPELGEKLDEAADSCEAKVKTRITKLRTDITAKFKKAAPKFAGKLAAADLGPEGPAFDHHDRVMEASGLLLYLRKFAGEL